MAKTDFQYGGCSGHLGFTITRFFRLQQRKFRFKSTKGLGKKVENWFSRWRLWQPSWIFNRLINFSYFVSTRRPDAPHQVSTQLDHSLQRRCPKYEFSTYFTYTVFAPFSAPGAKKIGKRGRLLGTIMLQERRFLKSSTRGSFIIRICVKVYCIHTV